MTSARMVAFKMFEKLYDTLPPERRSWSAKAAYVMVSAAIEENASLRQACVDDTLSRADVVEAMKANMYTAALDIDVLSPTQYLEVCAILKAIVKTLP